jgi:hypothetical protein
MNDIPSKTIFLPIQLSQLGIVSKEQEKISMTTYYDDNDLIIFPIKQKKKQKKKK